MDVTESVDDRFEFFPTTYLVKDDIPMDVTEPVHVRFYHTPGSAPLSTKRHTH